MRLSAKCGYFYLDSAGSSEGVRRCFASELLVSFGSLRTPSLQTPCIVGFVVFSPVYPPCCLVAYFMSNPSSVVSELAQESEHVSGTT